MNLGSLADRTSIVAFGLLLHEVGHFAAAEMCGLRVKNIVASIRPFAFGLMRSPGTPWQNFSIALAGPAANLLLFAAYASTDRFAAFGNLAFAILNLVLPHSDGWKAIAYLRTARGDA